MERSARDIVKANITFPWIGIGVFMGGENEIISRGWGENGRSMLKINYVTEEIAIVMTNQNPRVDQSESGMNGLSAKDATYSCDIWKKAALSLEEMFYE